MTEALKLVNIERACSSCAHAKVCSLLRAISPLLASWRDKPPIEVEDLAVICREYLDVSVLNSNL